MDYLTALAFPVAFMSVVLLMGLTSGEDSRMSDEQRAAGGALMVVSVVLLCLSVARLIQYFW